MKRALSFLCLGLYSTTMAQYSTAFESGEGFVGSSTGTSITGQNGWYLPPVTGSVDGLVFTYAGNSIGVSAHPSGGDQFLGMVSQGNSTALARAQRAFTFVNGKYTVVFDFNAKYNGTLPSVDNIGSWSLQPSLATVNYFQSLYAWGTNTALADKFNANYGVWSAAGGDATNITFQNAGAAWTDLTVNHWYRQSTTWDFSTGEVTEVTIQNLTTGGSIATANPSGWYLAGGANNVLGKTLPTDFRMFGGGATAGNIWSVDNFSMGLSVSTETLAPISEQIALGTQNSGGNLASWAADDNDARNICKFFVPSITSPFIRVNLSYTTTKTSPTAISFNVKVGVHTPGPQAITLKVENKVTNLFVNTSVAGAASVNGTTYNGAVSGTLSEYIAGGAMRGQIEILQTGPSTQVFPCSSFEFAQMAVTG